MKVECNFLICAKIMHKDTYYAGNPRKRHRPLLATILVLLLLSLDVISCIKWLGIYREKSGGAWNNTKDCKKFRANYGFTGEQTKLCRKIADCMPFVHEAADLTLKTCQSLFRHRQWNCSSIRLLPKLSPELSKGTKERAFVHALSAAALTFMIAKGCASSSINSCSCSSHPGDPPNGHFKWGGCGDNVQWGSKFSKQFVDAKKKPTDKQRKYNKTYAYYNYQENEGAQNDDDNDIIEYNTGFTQLIKNHNGQLGRKIVEESLVTHCKCHGVSGSCSIKTCWRGLPLKFQEIGEKLLMSYNTAVQVHPMTRPDQLMNRFTESQSLLYASNSPNYCEFNPKSGSFGTIGRECNNSATIHESCENMCCGRGYKSTEVVLTEKCKCTYHWCCYVTCDTCRIKKKIDICN